MIRQMNSFILGFLLLAASCSDRPHSHDVTYYDFRIIQRADSFFAWIDYSSFDTTALAIADGFVMEFDPVWTFFGYDSSVIKFSGHQIIPVGAGKTILYVRSPNTQSNSIVDSALLEVRDQNGRYLVSSQPFK